MTEFEKASQQFLACLTKSGADISNKIELKDLRNQQAGRGVSKSKISSDGPPSTGFNFVLPNHIALQLIDSKLRYKKLKRTNFSSAFHALAFSRSKIPSSPQKSRKLRLSSSAHGCLSSSSCYTNTRTRKHRTGQLTSMSFPPSSTP